MGEVTLKITVDASEVQLTIDALSLLARAIDAMSRTEPNGVSTVEWDGIVVEGTALLQKAVVR